MRKTCRLYVDVEYDSDVTDSDSLVAMMDNLLKTILSTHGVVEDFGEPYIGDFYIDEDYEEDV